MTSIRKKFTSVAGLQFLSKGLIALSGVIIARTLGPSEYGQYGYVLSIVTIATLPVVAGLSNLIVREVANNQAEKSCALLGGFVFWSQKIMLQASFAVVVFMVVILRSDIFELDISALLWLGVILIPLRGLLVFQGAVINGYRKPVLAQLPSQFLSPAVTLVVLILFWTLEIELNVNLVMLITISASFIAAGVGRVLFYQTHHKTITCKHSEYVYSKRKWLRSLLPFSLISILVSLNSELAVFILGWIGSTESVAFIKVSMQATIIVSVGLTAVNTIIMPDIARSYKEGKLKETQGLLSRSVRLSVFFSIPIIAIFVIFGEEVIQFIFGYHYMQSYPSLVVLCLGQVANVFCGSVGAVLYMTGNEMKALRVLCVSLCVNVISISIFVPIYQDVGAAISTALSLLVLNVLMAKEVKKITGLKTWFQTN